MFSTILNSTTSSLTITSFTLIFFKVLSTIINVMFCYETDGLTTEEILKKAKFFTKKNNKPYGYFYGFLYFGHYSIEKKYDNSIMKKAWIICFKRSTYEYLISEKDDNKSKTVSNESTSESIESCEVYLLDNHEKRNYIQMDDNVSKTTVYKEVFNRIYSKYIKNKTTKSCINYMYECVFGNKSRTSGSEIFLLYGPPGKGKSTIAKLFAEHLKVKTKKSQFIIEDFQPCIVGNTLDPYISVISDVYKQHEKSDSKIIIILEEIDSYFNETFTKRDNIYQTPMIHNKSSLNRFCDEIIGEFSHYNNVIVIMTTNKTVEEINNVEMTSSLIRPHDNAPRARAIKVLTDKCEFHHKI